HHLLGKGRRGTYACSIVSSSLLGKMASAAGQPFAETLTGFKWISKVDDLVFGYEEALGYCVDPEHVKDKDGVSALLLLCELAGGARVVVRPSGTEPKLKCYLEVVVPVDPEAGVDAARISAAARLDALRDDIRAAAGI